MSTCNDIEPLVPPYLDQELADSDLRELEQHVAECGPCRHEIRAAEAVQRALRQQLAPPRAPDALRDRIVRGLDAADADDRRAERRARWSWALPAASSVAAAAALFLFVFAGPLAPAAEHAATEPAAEPQPERVAHEAVRQRFRASPVMVPGNRGEVSRSAAQYLRVPVRPPSFGRDDVDLLGWQPSNLRGRQAALFLYQVEGPSGRHQVNVHVLDARNLDLRSQDRVRVGARELWIDRPFGFSSVSFRDTGGIGYVFTSDMPSAELVALVAESDILDHVSERLRR